MWGVDIKPEFPEKPNILVINNFDKNVKKLSSEIFLKIKNIFH